MSCNPFCTTHLPRHTQGFGFIHFASPAAAAAFLAAAPPISISGRAFYNRSQYPHPYIYNRISVSFVAGNLVFNPPKHEPTPPSPKTLHKTPSKHSAAGGRAAGAFASPSPSSPPSGGRGGGHQLSAGNGGRGGGKLGGKGGQGQGQGQGHGGHSRGHDRSPSPPRQ